MRIPHWTLAVLLAAPSALSLTGASAQLAQRDGSAPVSKSTAPHRTRLILKDGSYQIVMSYTVAGNRVRFVSAERGGDAEEIPLALVDLPATQLWDKQHAPPDPNSLPEKRPAPALDPELIKEEVDRVALAPEVAPNLRLAPEVSALVLDTFRSNPELVPLNQSQGDLRPQPGHNILRGIVNPQSASHSIVVLKGERSPVQLHVPDPAFYLKLDDELLPGGSALTVDTRGASTQAGNRKLNPTNDYVIVRLDVRTDARIVSSFNIAALGDGKPQDNVVETTATVLPGKHWLKIVPEQQLLIGEYALVEILNEKELNLGVWEFGVHPTASENRDLIKPEARHSNALGHREPD